MPLWSTPKTNWIPTDGIDYNDLNRMEQNVSDLRDAVFRKVQGFGFRTGIGVNYIRILPGSCFSEDFYPLNMVTGGIKAFTAHALGFGTTVGGMAPGVTIAADTWYYIFALGHATSSAVEIMIDSSPTGANVSLANYPYKRYVNSFKTDTSSNAIEMFSTGDQVFINPNSMLAARELPFAGSSGTNNQYQTITLTDATRGFLLPQRNVKAQLNCYADDNIDEFGFYARSLDATSTGLNFTIPTNLLSGGVYYAEVLGVGTPTSPSNRRFTLDCDIFVNSSRQLELAINSPASPWGVVYIAVRGYQDTREHPNPIN